MATLIYTKTPQVQVKVMIYQCKPSIQFISDYDLNDQVHSIVKTIASNPGVKFEDRSENLTINEEYISLENFLAYTKEVFAESNFEVILD